MGKKENKIVTLLTVVLGNMLYALSVKLFLLPAGLVTGGTTGIGLAVQYAFGLPVGTFVLIFNVIMLVIGYMILGKKFAMTTIVSTFVYPLSLHLFDYLLGDIVLTDDILISAVFSGVGIGAALGVVIRSGASTGGMDIPPLILNHYFRLPVSVSMYAFDILILLVQAVFQPLQKVFYGIILIMIYTIVLDKLMLLGTTRTEVKVVTKYPDQIRAVILEKLDRGVTMLDAESGYLRQSTQMVFSIISNRELPRVERMIHEVDPDCFMVVSRVSEVRGKGFSKQKEYLDF